MCLTAYEFIRMIVAFFGLNVKSCFKLKFWIIYNQTIHSVFANFYANLNLEDNICHTLHLF